MQKMALIFSVWMHVIVMRTSHLVRLLQRNLKQDINFRLIKVAYIALLGLTIASGLLSSCKPNNTKVINPIETIVSTNIPPGQPTTSQSPTPTHKASLTVTQTPTQTRQPTRTHTPTITPTRTQDLSFYEAAECLPKDTGYQKATVIDVIDGDTIEVQLTGGITATVRYIGIDTPESGLPYSEAASQANSDLVLREEIFLIRDESETDSFGRLLRYVVAGGVFVNQELVQKGYAKAVVYPPDEACKDAYSTAELAAKQAKLGLWAPTPTPEPYAGQVVILTVNKREEWVDIQNVGDYEVDLAGWNLVSERGEQGCPLSGTLGAGQTLRIWAMAAQGPGFSCGYNSPIWNNSESDPAVLYNAQGVEVSRK